MTIRVGFNLNPGNCSVIIKFQCFDALKSPDDTQQTPINRFPVAPMEFIALPTNSGAIFPFDFSANATLRKHCGVVVGKSCIRRRPYLGNQYHTPVNATFAGVVLSVWVERFGLLYSHSLPASFT